MRGLSNACSQTQDAYSESENSLIEQIQYFEEKEEVSLLSYGHELFPKALVVLEDMPVLLYVVGKYQTFVQETRFIAVVGSRAATIERCRFTESFCTELRKQNVCIVSGLAKGIDAAAHRGAICSQEGAMPTIAFLGQGMSGQNFQTIYPASNRALAEAIVAAGGLLYSEYPPGTPALPIHFLARNRLIAALAQAVVIIQAALKSGSLVTARMANEYGKEVLVVPGEAQDLQFEGSHKLIREGAYLVTSVRDVCETLYPGVPFTFSNQLKCESLPGQLVAGHVYSLAALSKQGLTQEQLLKLELSGKIETTVDGQIRCL